MTELEIEAKRLYDKCWTIKPNKPKWEQLGEATKSVWMEVAAISLAEKAKEKK